MAVDFETQLYNESMDVLEHHIKPLHSLPGVVLEQSYLNKMSEGVKPLAVLANMLTGMCHCMQDSKITIWFLNHMASYQQNVYCMPSNSHSLE